MWCNICWSVIRWHLVRAIRRLNVTGNLTYLPSFTSQANSSLAVFLSAFLSSFFLFWRKLEDKLEVCSSTSTDVFSELALCLFILRPHWCDPNHGNHICRITFWWTPTCSLHQGAGWRKLRWCKSCREIRTFIQGFGAEKSLVIFSPPRLLLTDQSTEADLF